MKTPAVGQALINASTPSTTKPSDKEIIDVCIKALRRSTNFWLKKDVNEGNIKVSIDKNKILLTGSTESPINQQNAYDCVQKKASKLFPDMEIVNYINVTAAYAQNSTSRGNPARFGDIIEDDDDLKNVDLREFTD